MKIIVGLGNPGKKYAGTRHNLGFEAIDSLANKLGVTRIQTKFDAEIGDSSIDGEKVLLVRPLTYMNLSGRAVRPIVDFYQLPLSELLVICDDLSLPPGKIRIRGQGSAGGQKGLQNICDLLGTNVFPRLRIGIGAAPPQWDAADYVLSRFNKDETSVIADAISRATDATIVWIKSGLVAAMNQYN